MNLAEQADRVRRLAHETYQTSPDWITFYRKILGSDGVVRRTFTSAEELAEFEKTGEYAEIQRLLAELRRRESEPNPEEPTYVITVRLPRAVHETLFDEAHEYRTTLNKLCISKLLRLIDAELVPSSRRSQQGRVRRGKYRPGSGNGEQRGPGRSTERPPRVAGFEDELEEESEVDV